MRRKGNTLYEVLDQYTGENVTYKKVTTFMDGSSMNDSKCDGIIYKKLVTNGTVEYFKRVYKGYASILWFGAKGDGVTDDTTAFYNAANAIRGGAINIPNGSYVISQPFPFRRGIRWVGEGCLETISGRSTTIKLKDGANCNLVETLPQIGSTTGDAFYQGLEHIAFDGNASNQTVDHLIGINVKKAYITFYLNHIKVSNVKGTALSFHDGADVKIDHVWLVQNVILDSNRYCVEINQDLAAPNLAGYLNFNHLYVENTSNKIGGNPRDNVEDRANAILIKRTASANFNELHLEGHARMVDVDTSNVVTITKISTAHCGNPALEDGGVIRLLNDSSAVTVNSMRIYNTSGALLKKATGFTHNEISDIPQINASSTASYNVGFKVSGYGTIPYYLPKTVISNLLRISKVGSYSPQYLRFDTDETGAVYTYIKNNSQNLTFGSKFNQGTNGSEFDLLRLSFTAIGKGQIIALGQIRLDTTTLNTEFSQYSIGVSSKGATYGTGPVYSRLNANANGLDFIKTTIVGTTTPNIGASYVGQEYFNFTTGIFYIAKAVGSTPASNDWVGIELVSNKSTSTTLGNSDSLYPTQNAVKIYVDTTLNNSVASDTEVQITSANTEDNKLVSRLKLFNWWTWIKTQAQTIAGSWTFNSAISAATAPTNNNHLTNKSYVDGEDSLTQKKISTKTAAYTATTQDSTILVDGTNGAYTITLPTATSAYNGTLGGFCFTIKKIDSSANNVTIKANGTELIDGVNTQVISTQWMSLTVQSNGTSWFLI
jgi:hypothetical protein